MALIIQATKEIQIKIVYYGPAKSGKTTNLEQVQARVQVAAGQTKSKLLTVATNTERTLLFDYLPLEAPTIGGYRCRFQLYTVPGQIIYGLTRQLVLRGVDGIVFVADSQYELMPQNLESFADMIDNLRSLKFNLSDIPYVLQYNKQDLPNAAPKEYLDYVLNDREVKVPSSTAAASRGEGVFESLNAISRMLIMKYLVEREKRGK
jgi:signal recognition particle receptor subunit beta